MDNISEQVAGILEEHLGVEPESIHPAALLEQDLGADSMDAMAVLLAVNEHFNLKLSASAMDKVQTVDDLVKVIQSSR